ncbi:membrane protein involved in the export of O-antigen and teichoic acid [Deinococcus peraridilitoris DSM 19664]|uniref:Membrane protein involved in the export of O-antigen and teichoic acid n=1 Tax=Deinococcus peraridilitoris (strain DSM 19664 / LMG 22246 / CIP 109416 / KR-200) TaxID=937777 RepID=K9ZXV8_DEIPD|nr:membrane protein involved in the export of O-antigen and teichoic acid [Deinococcus peraridilitoris DSM 19664]
MMALGTLASMLLGFLVQAYLARHASVAEYGQINYARVLIGYFALVLNFGFDTYFLRQITADRFPEGRAVAMQLTARLPLALVFLAGLLWWAAAAGWPTDRLVVVLFGVTLLHTAFNLDWLLQARQKFSVLAALNISRSAVTLVATYLLVGGSGNPMYYVVALILSETTRLALQWKFVRPVMEKTSSAALIATLRQSVAISASFFMISIYYNADSLMLKYYLGSEAVGIYSAAYNILVLAIVPTTLLYQVFSPRLAQNPWSTDVLKKYAASTMALAIVVFVGVISLHSIVIHVVYGNQFAEASRVLMILSFNILSSYLAGALANPINMWGAHVVYLRIVAVGAVLNIALNLIAIPMLGINGAIFATIASEVAVAGGAALTLWRRFGTFPSGIGRRSS